MRIFVTGATGFVGSAVVSELLAHGHQVIGLVRSEASATRLAATGAEAIRGDLTDPESLMAGAAMADGVIHTAFIHDFSRFQENCDIDRMAIEALGTALAGSDRPLIVTSGTGLLPPGGLATESTEPQESSIHVPRVSEQTGLAQGAKGVRVSVVRLPPSVHGEGDHGFIPILIDIARSKGAAAYIGDGTNVWPAVHRLDAARLYRLAIEKAATGARYHAVAEEGIAFRDIAGVIGRRLAVPVVARAPEEAAEHFGWFAHFAGIDNPSSATQSRETLGWEPRQAGLLDDMDHDYYFAG